MAAICILDEFEVHKNKTFLDKAEALKPELHEVIVHPRKLLQFERHLKVERKPDMNETIVTEEDFEELPKKKFKRNDHVVLDFGDHYVGYLTLDLASAGSHQDAPAYIYLRFAERIEELGADPAEYDGWISKSWLQEEYIHVDVLPCELKLPRRYAFRYLEIRVIDVSMKYSLVINGVRLRAVSSVRQEDVPPLKTDDPLLRRIDEVSVRTLHNCMQDVFEDGPKRDRRLWLGDFRLQARADYQTFKNYDLAKRCLYLFSGMTFNEGKLSACLFTEPVPEPDDTYLFDFALLFGSALLDYYEETKDRDTLCDLYPTAVRQIEIGLDYLDSDLVIPDRSNEFWCFIDWGEGLNTQAASLAVLIYSLRYGIRLANYMGDRERAEVLALREEELKKSAVEHFWDEDLQMFVSGADRQISWATQIWMILARVFPQEKNRELILRTIDVNPRIQMVTPYMYHHYVDALIRSGEKERALNVIRSYWGEMVHDGADTFWEVYNPYNKYESPYGSVMVNSFCHAWSCTPTYFLRKFYGNGQ